MVMSSPFRLTHDMENTAKADKSHQHFSHMNE